MLVWNKILGLSCKQYSFCILFVTQLTYLLLDRYILYFYSYYKITIYYIDKEYRKIICPSKNKKKQGEYLLALRFN